MSEFEAIDAAYGIGDQRAQVEALVARQSAATPLADGRQVELYFRTFSSTEIEHKRAVADEFAAAEVLAVLGARDFTYGAVRLAETHGVPVIDVNAVPRTVFARTDPWMFTIRCAQDIVYLTYVEWAHRTGRLEGRRIGVFSDRYTATSAGVAMQRLTELGHRVAVHVSSDGVGVGSDHDQEVVRRFADGGVDLMMPFVSGSSLARALSSAADQNYHPVVLDLETGEHVTDVAGSVMPSSIYDGTRALAMSRVGEVAAGRALDPRARGALECVESATGVTLTPVGRACSGAVSNVLMVADLVEVLFLGLRRAGPEPDRVGLVRALESITDHASVSGGTLSFRPGEHWGCRAMREIEWRQGAWSVVGDYEAVAGRSSTGSSTVTRCISRASSP